MKIFKTAEFIDNNVLTKKYYFCGIRLLKKSVFNSYSYTFKQIYFFNVRLLNYIKHNFRPADNGISIIEIGDISGEGKTGRTAINSLERSGINFDCGLINDLYIRHTPKYKKQLVFSTADFLKNPSYDIIPLLVWEFESGMEHVRPWAFKNISAIATFSTFCETYFKKIAPKNLPIYVLPYPIDIDLSKLESVRQVRTKYRIKPHDFVFFFNFSYTSSYFRKNPEGTLDAFALAFPKCSKDIKLIIKTVGSTKSPDLVNRLSKKVDSLKLNKNVILIDDELTDYETYSLINACDVYISLHRGEGLGLGMMEAMAMSKPVIATNYGGNTDFTTKKTALLVDYEMVKPKEIDIDAYKYVEKWPEPNIKTAAKHMKYLYKNKDFGKKLGKTAQKFVSKNFNATKFNNVIKKIIKG